MVMFRDPQIGDLLMDAPKTSSWRELQAFALDKDYWRKRVRGLKPPRINYVEMDPEVEPGSWTPFTISS